MTEELAVILFAGAIFIGLIINSCLQDWWEYKHKIEKLRLERKYMGED